MTETSHTTPCLFEIHHGSTVLRIADDWSGHVLIERLYVGLREARRARDIGHMPPTPPAPGREAESSMIEAALFHGFRRIGETTAYQATAEQIAALMREAHEQGRMEALRAAASDG